LLVLGTLQNGMGLANVPGPTQTVVFGVLLIASVVLPRTLRKALDGRRRAAASPVAPPVPRDMNAEEVSGD
jgi:rhamnose transport system permease protein